MPANPPLPGPSPAASGGTRPPVPPLPGQHHPTPQNPTPAPQTHTPTPRTPAPPTPHDQTPPSPRRRWPGIALAVYVAVLAAIAFWPSPVDSGAGGLLSAVERLLPFATYQRVEFGANILLFVPLGALLSLVLRQRHLVLPIALVTTVVIEAAQAVALDRRTPTVLDIVANATGACLGLLLVAFFEWLHTHRTAPPRR